MKTNSLLIGDFSTSVGLPLTKPKFRIFRPRLETGSTSEKKVQLFYQCNFFYCIIYEGATIALHLQFRTSSGSRAFTQLYAILSSPIKANLALEHQSCSTAAADNSQNLCNLLD